MGSGEEPPRQVAALEKEGFEVLSWGGDNTAGVVEWRSRDSLSECTMRNCRRWATVNGMELGDHHVMAEYRIAAANIDIWGEEMRKMALNFRAVLQRAEPPRGRRKGRR